MKELVSVDEARALIRDRMEALSLELGRENLELSQALGRVAAADVYAGEDFPSFKNSAMDGFAVRSVDAARRELRLVGESRAGRPWEGVVADGDCIRISTGAGMPKGADAVAPVERLVREDGTRIILSNFPPAGANVRPSGADIRKGERVLGRGDAITPPNVALLAMVGRVQVEVFQRPVVSVVSTGDELLPAATPPPLPYGFIRDSNGPGLAALVQDAGGSAGAGRLVADRKDTLLRALVDAAGVDMIVVTGGISVGPHDHVRTVLEEAGAEVVFWRIRQRPGKPMAFAVLEGCPVFCLPGNPVSSAVCFLQYVRPAIRQLMGGAAASENLIQVRAAQAIKKAPGLHHFVRGVVDFQGGTDPLVRTTGEQGSNLASSVALANCLIHLEEARADVESGEVVFVELLPWAGR